MKTYSCSSYNPLNPNDHKALRNVAKGVKAVGVVAISFVLGKKGIDRIRKKK